MLDVVVLCEGQTEREFCRDVVGPDLALVGVALSGTLVGKPHRKQGGIRPWQTYRAELLRLASERADRHVAVLVDYYGMPPAWPGRAAAAGLPKDQRGAHVESALRDALSAELPGRFHPCVQLHEFESLLFVDPQLAALSIAVAGSGIGHERAARLMADVKSQCGGSVEQINDDPQSAPSKRIAQIIAGYDKVAWGVTAAKDVTLPVLRSGCPWLDRWVQRLAGLPGNAAPHVRTP
jgi:hypothetical protein